jgi:HAD superfamily hydrolase (TIGR01509 family)
MFQALIFDYGGTLDTNGNHWFPVLWEAYRRAGAPFSRDHFRNAYIHAERMLEERRLIDVSDDFLDTLLKKCHLHLEYLIENQLIPPGESAYQNLIETVATDCDRSARRSTREASRILEPLARRHQMVVLSNFHGNLRRVLEVYGLDALFDHVLDSATLGTRKPDPGIFSIAIRRTGLKPEEVAVIGDSFENDILPASQLGCGVFWLKGEGWNPGTDLDEKAVPGKVHILDSLGDLPRLLG